VSWAAARCRASAAGFEPRERRAVQATGGGVRKFHELSYANASDPWHKRLLIHAFEDVSGRNRLVPIYEAWRIDQAAAPDTALTRLMERLNVGLQVISGRLDPAAAVGQPLVIVSNHPFGILDGVATLAISERLGRPGKVLINNDLLKVPEAQYYSLPIDFAPTRAAQQNNIRTKREALRLLKAGTSVIVFPGGGIATTPTLFGVAAELPWKTFVARMIQEARASVLPLFFEGQCRPRFHLASRYGPTLRLSMIVGEFRRQLGTTLRVHVGAIVPFEQLAHPRDRIALTQELYDRVHQLSGRAAPSQHGLPEWLVPKKRREENHATVALGN
jgi:putative hemolysin